MQDPTEKQLRVTALIEATAVFNESMRSDVRLYVDGKTPHETTVLDIAEKFFAFLNK